jgi:2-dehydro-3-deoxyphosphogluconate aldolase/(4S)-4-hydroxy-2-oxoglutarate aldolase
MNVILKHLQKEGIIPVVTISRSDDAQQIVEALLKGGISTVEITLRTEEGVKAISYIKENFPEMVVGAGTVTNMNRFEGALSARADFFVTPGMNRSIIERALQAGKLIIPGLVTPTELEIGLSFGLQVFKFFPSEPFGGVNTIKALAGPYPNVLFVPTGWINPENARQYLADKHVLAVGGSWLVKDLWVKEGKFEEITKCAIEARALINEIREEAVTHA